MTVILKLVEEKINSDSLKNDSTSKKQKYDGLKDQKDALKDDGIKQPV